MLESLAKLAICKVVCGSEIGTGFLVAPDRVLTALHCVRGGISGQTTIDLSFIALLEGEETEFQAKVVDTNEELDACILSFSDARGKYPLRISAQPIREGTTWVSYGFPAGKAGIEHRLFGTVSNVLALPVAKTDFDFSIDPSSTLSRYEGMSGAPVLVGDLCSGFLRLKLNGTVGGISIKALSSFLASNGIATESDAESSTQQLAERAAFQHDFEANVIANSGRFHFLQGPHGIGKTTLCDRFEAQHGSLLFIGTFCVRELSGQTTTAIRSQPEILFDWISTTVSSLLTGRSERQKALTYAEMAQETSSLLDTLSDYCQRRDRIGVMFIDGLDEISVYGGERLANFVGLFPQSLPDHVAIVLAAPNFGSIAAFLSGRVASNHVHTLPPLNPASSRDFCARMLRDLNTRTATFVDDLCSRANGHPLYLQYLIRHANAHPEDSQMLDFPVLDGSIEGYYEKIWSRLLNDPDATGLLTILARLRGTIGTEEFTKFLTEEERRVYISTFSRIEHLLRNKHELELYHDSLSLFIVSKTAPLDRSIHERLGKYCLESNDGDYCIRNKVFHALRGSTHFHEKAVVACDQAWVDTCVKTGVVADAIIADMLEVLRAALTLGQTIESCRLLLLANRVDFRHDTLFIVSATLVTRALIAVGQPKHALKHIVRHKRLASDAWDALSIVWTLIEGGYLREAMELIGRVERTCIDTYGSGESNAREYLDLTILHLLTVFLSRVSGKDQHRYVMAIQEQAAQVMEANRHILPQEFMDEFLQRIYGVPNCYFFTFRDVYIPNAALFKLHGSQIDNEQLLHTRVSILRDHLTAVKIFGLRVKRDSTAALFGDISELVSVGARIEDSELPDCVDLLIRLNAPSALIFSVIDGRQPATPAANQTSLRGNNGVDPDISEFLNSHDYWRTEAFINLELALPLVRRLSRGRWIEELEQLAIAVLFFDGRARRARVDAIQPLLGQVENAITDSLIPAFEFTLAERVAWDRSYSIPELVLPHLYRMLAELLADCFPHKLPEFLEWMAIRSSDQCGLYSEGFRETALGVSDYLSLNSELTNTRTSLVKLLISLKDHYLRGVENRHELVPGLLKLVPLFARVGASEEGQRVFQRTLAVSMGPSWYKEDQFSLMIEALNGVSARVDVRRYLGRIAGFLERASGEMTFQRYVRYQKSDFLGALVSRGLIREACAYFLSESFGDRQRLKKELDANRIDVPSRYLPSRHLGGRLDEQAAILSFVRHASSVEWQLRWSLLEIFVFGDFRHFESYAVAFANLVNEIGKDESVLRLTASRIADVVSTELPSKLQSKFVAWFKQALVQDFRASFDALFSQFPEATAREHSDQAPEPTVDDRDNSTKERKTSDGLFLPGVFGSEDASQEAQRLIEESREQFMLGNATAGQQRVIAALETLQGGGWPIWDRIDTQFENSQAMIRETAGSASEVTKLYSDLIVEDHYSPFWKKADGLISLTSQLVDDADAIDILEVVLEHVRLMVGNSVEEAELFASVFRDSPDNQPNTAVISLILAFADHPTHIRRQKAAELTLWLAQTHLSTLPRLANAAFQMTDGFSADVACGVLDVISYEDPVVVWRLIEDEVDLENVLTNTRHVSRLAELHKLAERAAAAGITSAAEMLAKVDARFIQGTVVFATSSGLRLPKWAQCCREEWKALEELEIASQELLNDWSSELSAGCKPYGIEEVLALEKLLSHSFRAPQTWPLDRWEGQVRNALNRSLFSFVSRASLDSVAERLRVWNPGAPCASQQPFAESRFHLALSTLAGESDDFSTLTRLDDQLVLYYFEAADNDRGVFAIEVIATLIPSRAKYGISFVPDMTAYFTSRVRPSSDIEMAEEQTSQRLVPNVCFFGQIAASEPSDAFLQSAGANESDCTRMNWREGRSIEFDHFGQPTAEGSLLSIRESAIKLPQNMELAWIICVNGDAQIVVDSASRILFEA